MASRFGFFDVSEGTRGTAMECSMKEPCNNMRWCLRCAAKWSNSTNM